MTALLAGPLAIYTSNEHRLFEAQIYTMLFIGGVFMALFSVWITWRNINKA